MKNCIFCSLVRQTDTKLCTKIENTILYENESIIIVPALGMSTPNYLMVISKQHLNGFAELNSDELVKLENLLNTICDEYFNIIGTYPIIFEHGSLPEGRHPLSITHAHLHIIPVNLFDENLKELLEELKLKKENDIHSLRKMKHKDYWMYRSETQDYYLSHSIKNASRSCFIKIVAKQLGFDESYEWRDLTNNREADVKETINTFKKMNLNK